MNLPANRFGGIVAVVCILFGSLFFTSNSFADIFKYVDKDGVIHFTNVPTQPNYRKLPPLPALPMVAPRGVTYWRLSPSRYLLPPRTMANQFNYDLHIKMACDRHGLDCNLVKAVIRAESAFDAQALSPKGAMGLMQLMPGTSKDLGVTDPFDPYQNIEGGVRYLKTLLNRFNNDVPLALAAYNSGPETVQKYGGIPPYDETQVYVQRVLDYYLRYNR